MAIIHLVIHLHRPFRYEFKRFSPHSIIHPLWKYRLVVGILRNFYGIVCVDILKVGEKQKLIRIGLLFICLFFGMKTHHKYTSVVEVDNAGNLPVTVANRSP